MTIRTMKLAAWMTLAAALAATACGPQAASTANRSGSGSAAAAAREPRGAPMPHEACVDGGGAIESVDVNGDGRPDIRSVSRGGRLACRESDANFDGRVDIIRFFDADGVTVTRVEDDYDFDGRIDMVAMYRAGQLAEDVLDTNFDGRTDTWRTYTNGRVSELRRDSNADGRVDMWEDFDSNGRVTRTRVDTNGDGQPDAEPDAGVIATSALQGTTAAPAQDAAVEAAAAPDASTETQTLEAGVVTRAVVGGVSVNPDGGAR